MNETFTAKEIAENHDRFVKRSILYKEFRIDQEGLRSRLVRQLDIGNRTILEIGTGNGYFTTMLARDFDTVVSIDTDAEGQRIAELNAAYNDTLDKITFVTDDAGSLAFPDSSFDAAVTAFTFHHLVYPFRVIREMIRVAGRQIVISDFTSRGFEAIARIHANEGRHHDRGTGDFGIVGVFLREHGFDVSIKENTFQTLYVARRIDKEKE
ncbi:MAG: class I SAM-dependent methyltransferase [Spirochaetes bacterium]|jgi:ubiquinone/menaquinone biosynthesis C-methylase UbiE|nr:class I SAM-dependent methyltransferase [Spirochaetota bacterium]